ncbi:MAG TPA: phosphoglucomutase/phosphomannomutase family protein [Patescibacteria group bacterium]|nr:phosphoglucomutase/phosphomannomutase family protein [Patescibacteria group bacterium]
MENSKEIKFGTDGWRGIISDNFTFKNVRRVAQAVADYYNRQTGNQARMAVGYDTRFLSKEYADAVTEVLAANGIEVTLSDRPVPTPALSFAVRRQKLTSGIMITASHNPGAYNGIKIKTSSGGAAGVEVTGEVENLIANPSPRPGSVNPAAVRRVDMSREYVKFLRSYVDLKKVKNATFKVLVDVMHGSGNGFIAEVLKGTKIKIEFARQEKNPGFGGLRPEPVVENLKATMERMKNEKFDLCLVLDGDADRIAAVVPGGEFVSPQKILGLLALHLHQDRGMNGGVVKTIVGTNLMDNLTTALGLKLYETPVGFKYISALMEKEDILVGGEEAGGMGFKNYIPERDGSLAGLMLLEMMVYRKKNMRKILDDMERQFGRYYYLREDLHIKNPGMDVQGFKQTKSLLGKDVVGVKDYDGVKLTLRDGSWLMFRGSGTEPIMRVYAEAQSLAKSRKLIELGVKMILDLQK